MTIELFQVLLHGLSEAREKDIESGHLKLATQERLEYTAMKKLIFVFWKIFAISMPFMRYDLEDDLVRLKDIRL